MKLKRCAPILLLLGSLAGDLHACMGQHEPAGIPVYNLSAEQWSADVNRAEQRDLVIGSMLNLLVPKGARLTVTTLAQGAMAPVVLVDDDAYARLDRSRLLEREPLAAYSKLDGREVRHLALASYGKAQIDIESAAGARRLIVGAIYASPVPSGRPLALAEAGQGPLPIFDRSLRDAGLWLKAPGKVADGWQLQQADDNDFSILRIEQLAVPYGDPPAVGIFVHGSGSIKSGELALATGGLWSRRTFPFRVTVMPVPAC